MAEKQCPQERGAVRGGGLAGVDTEVQKAARKAAWGGNRRTDHEKKDGELGVHSLRRTRKGRLGSRTRESGRKITPPKDAHVITLRTDGYVTLHGKRESEGSRAEIFLTHIQENPMSSQGSL